MKRILLPLYLAALLLAASRADASDPYFAFEPGSTNLSSPENQTWQTQFESVGDYGESWFFVLQTDDGGVLFTLLSITNLGLRTFSGVVSVQWYPATGEPRRFHREVTRRNISASETSMDVRIGPARVWGGGRRYQVSIDDREIKLRLDFRGTLRPHQFGGGKVEFYEDRSAEWAIAFHAPRANVTGNLEIGGQSWELAGRGYHDHGWSTIKMPTFVERWHVMRLYHDEFTIVTHQLHLQERFGGGMIQLAIVGTEDEILGTSRRFRYRPVSSRRDPESGNRVPTEIDLSMRAGGYTITGKVTESRYLDSVDVLAQVSRPVRAVIRAFYSKPYLLRFLADYDLEISGPDGEARRIDGRAVIEANYY